MDACYALGTTTIVLPHVLVVSIIHKSNNPHDIVQVSPTMPKGPVYVFTVAMKELTQPIRFLSEDLKDIENVRGKLVKALNQYWIACF